MYARQRRIQLRGAAQCHRRLVRPAQRKEAPAGQEVAARVIRVQPHRSRDPLSGGVELAQTKQQLRQTQERFDVTTVAGQRLKVMPPGLVEFTAGNQRLSQAEVTLRHQVLLGRDAIHKLQHAVPAPHRLLVQRAGRQRAGDVVEGLR